MPPDSPVPLVNGSATKFPHTRALLAALAHDYGVSNKNTNKSSSETSDSEPESEGKEDTTNSDTLVAQVIQLLDDEDEDALKDFLKLTFGISDESVVEHNVLELMHRRRDDLANVPFLFFTPIKRPSRPTSRNSVYSYRSSRPGTPSLGPSSPLAQSFRRPITPLAGPTITYPNASPSSSPTPAAAVPNGLGSPTSSPLPSPRFLNAKATEFRPAMVRSQSTNSILRSPSPDLWAHNYSPSPTLSSASLTGRGSSNLAIAAPLLPEYAYSPTDEDGHSNRTPPILIPQDVSRPPYDDEDEDPFSPFVVKQPPSTQHLLNSSRPPSDAETQWSASSNSNSSPSNSYDTPPPLPEDYYSYSTLHLQQYPRPGYLGPADSNTHDVEGDPRVDYMPDDGNMTPFDVLSSVFGGTIPPAMLDQALVESGYDFEGAMAWLVDQALPAPSAGLLHQQPGPIHPLRSIGSGVMLASRDAPFSQARLSSNPNGRNNGLRYNTQQQQKASAGGNRVCRYFLAGDCRRADCRFSHDIDRALCRFWLRGQCAKGEQCEFLHHLPQHIDVQGLTAAMHRVDIVDDREPSDHPRNDFPTLSQAEMRNGRRGAGPFQSQVRPADPSRTRWAATVKKPIPQPPTVRPGNGSSAADDPVVRSINGPVARPSPRIRLRSASLLPTLPTGDALNKLYMAYRSRAIELGATRNACLARAAECWRRGDGAGAKRHSREAHELNGKMGLEAGKAAARLVRERARVAVEAVRARDTNWSDDPGDRAAKGKTCGSDLGVCLGIAKVGIQHEKRLSPEERTECLLDLHGLHSNEAVEVVEDFLVALETEHFFGLAYLIVGEEKHTGTQDTGRGASRARLAAGVREWLFKWGYPWSERDGIICVDPLTHAQ